MKSFQERLKAVTEKGNLRHADLARWFDRRQSTIHCWAKGSGPAGPPGDLKAMYRLLDLIEEAIRERELPLPLLPPSMRIRKLARLRETMRRRPLR